MCLVYAARMPLWGSQWLRTPFLELGDEECLTPKIKGVLRDGLSIFAGRFTGAVTRRGRW